MVKRNWAKRVGIMPTTPNDYVTEAKDKTEQAKMNALMAVPLSQPVQVDNTPAAVVNNSPKGNGTTTTFKNTTNGEVGGIKLPDGRIFLGLNPDQVRKIAEREAGKSNFAGATPASEGGSAMAAEQQSREATILANQIVPNPQGDLGTDQLNVGNELKQATVQSTGQIVGQGLKMAAGGAIGGRSWWWSRGSYWWYWWIYSRYIFSYTRQS